jgi:uncharacterized protein DUF1320
MSYSTLAQFGIYGLRRENILPRVRTVTAVDASANTIAVQAHDWAGAEYLQLAVVTGSAETPALPAGLSATTVYRPLPVTGSDTLVKLSLTEGGTAVDITDTGTGTFTVTEQLGPIVQAFLDAAQARVDEALTDYAPNLPSPAPTIVVWVECKLAAYDMAIAQALVVPSYWEQARETIAAQHDRALEYLADWKAGKPIQGLSADATPGTEENGAVILDGRTAPSWFADLGGAEAV